MPSSRTPTKRGQRIQQIYPARAATSGRMPGNRPRPAPPSARPPPISPWQVGTNLVKNNRHSARLSDANTRDMRDRAPAPSFTAVCDSPPADRVAAHRRGCDAGRGQTQQLRRGSICLTVLRRKGPSRGHALDIGKQHASHCQRDDSRPDRAIAPWALWVSAVRTGSYLSPDIETVSSNIDTTTIDRQPRRARPADPAASDCRTTIAPARRGRGRVSSGLSRQVGPPG